MLKKIFYINIAILILLFFTASSFAATNNKEGTPTMVYYCPVSFSCTGTTKDTCTFKYVTGTTSFSGWTLDKLGPYVPNTPYNFDKTEMTAGEQSTYATCYFGSNTSVIDGTQTLQPDGSWQGSCTNSDPTQCPFSVNR